MKKVYKPVIRLLIVYGMALGINYTWEMLQMPFYKEMSFADPVIYLQCLRASFGDANIIIALYCFGLLVFRDWRWPLTLTPWRVVYLILAGGSIAVLIELFALTEGHWSYSPLMPHLPFVQVGIIPIAQLIVLPYVSFFLACRIKAFGT